MGCLLAVFGLIAPRLILVVLWLFTTYLSRAFDSFVWPFLGFIFLPTTTLGYAIAQNSFDGVRGVGLVLVVLAVLIDVGVIGKGAWWRRK
jgi:hypothetical protein